jgi:hypothetical protein
LLQSRAALYQSNPTKKETFGNLASCRLPKKMKHSLILQLRKKAPELQEYAETRESEPTS